MTEDVEPRQGGAWIGQEPDENTQQVRENLPDDADRVAVTSNESDAAPDTTGWPRGHREGDPVSDDDVRREGR